MAVWKNIVPPKVELFVWMAMQNCIASKSSLVRRGILHSNLDLFSLCNASGEFPVHLLLHCDVAWNVWSEMISWWHIIWVSPLSLKELFQWWRSIRFKNLERLCWLATFYSVIWTIWTCRNDVVFNNKGWAVEDTCELVKTRMAMWIKGKYNTTGDSIEDFKRNLDGVGKVRI